MVTYQSTPQDLKWHQFTVRDIHSPRQAVYGLMMLSEADSPHFAVLIRNLLKTASGMNIYI